MKGMTIEQFSEVLAFVQKYHKFANWPTSEEEAEIAKQYPKMPKMGLNIKYTECSYDSRGNGDIWSITFRGINELTFSTNSKTYLTEKQKLFVTYNNLFDWVMDYLKGEWNVKNIIDVLY